MFYRKILGLFFILWSCCFAGNVLADNFTFVEARDVSVNIYGQSINWATDPVYIDKVIYVPLRDIMPLLDISIFTNRRTLQTTLQRRSDNLQVVIEEGSALLTLGSSQERLASDVRMIKNRIYIPFQSFMEKLGYKVLRDKRTYIVTTQLKSLIRDKQSFLLEANAPFDYYVNYNNQKRQLHVRISGALPGFDKRNLLENLARVGISSFNIKQMDDNLPELLLDVFFFPETRYNLYKYEGRNLMELEVYPSTASARSASARDNQVSVNIKPQSRAVTAPTEAVKKDSPRILFTTGRFDKPSHNSIWLPNIRDRKNIVFSVSGVDLTIAAPFQYQDGALMVPLRLFFEKAGYNVHINPGKKTAVVNRDDGIDYLLTAGKADIVDRSIPSKSKAALKLDRAPWMSADDMLVPLVSFARLLGMGVRWDARQEKVFINHRIYEVVYEEYKGLRQLTMKCTGEITLDKVLESITPSVLFVTLPNTNLDVPEQIVNVNDEKIMSYRLVQLTNNTCRLAIDTKGIIPYGILANDNILESTVRFPAGISRINLKSGKNQAEVQIEATGKVTPSIQELDNPARLVIDVPDAVLKSPQFYQGDGHVITRVRASQFQWNPLVTRIVVELEKSAFYTLQKTKDDRQLNLLFSFKEIKDKPKEEMKRLVPTKPGTEASLFKDTLIVVEAGHGGTDPGSIGYSGVYEKELTLATAKMLQEELEHRGARVIMPRESDMYMSLNDRVVFANQNKADMFISVHYNSFVNNMISGVETFYTKPVDLPLADSIHKRMVDKLRRTDKGVRKAMLYVLHYTQMPAICIEPLFLSNKWDELLAKDSEIQRKVAVAVTEGIEDYLKNTRKSRKEKNDQP